MNAIIKYPGAKWSMAQWIISHFPPHHSYLEPFFGSGAVLFHKPPSHIETVNDLDGSVVNLFRCIREDPERLAREVSLTPYSRAVFDAACGTEIPEDRFSWAAQFLIRCNQAYGYRTNEVRVGWKRDIAARERAYAARYWADLPEVIAAAAERLRGVQIECQPAVKLIREYNFPNVLIYADPPYVLSSRSGGKRQYRHEMTDANHMELLEALKTHRGPVLLSGYESPLYSRALAGWRRETASNTDRRSRPRREVLWMNFDIDTQECLFL